MTFDPFFGAGDAFVDDTVSEAHTERLFSVKSGGEGMLSAV